ncbi:MAG TPA: glycosyltransferase family 2 protein [Terriglobia bacterium]|nr:glycosyltransferase family 2 protein [Terriglobia bacterium]
MSEPIPVSPTQAEPEAPAASGPDRQLGKAPLSVLILTRNEEVNLGACLASVRWAAEAFVVDSLSTDRTVEIARQHGAQVHPHAFEGYASQRAWALENLPFAHDWILMLDADERAPAPLAEEITRVVRDRENTAAGFYLARRFFFQGRWLKHGGLYPTWLLRLFRRGKARVEQRAVNEHVIVEGKAGYLTQPFDHVDRRPLTDWIAKQSRYAQLEAEDDFRERHPARVEGSIAASYRGSQPERKRWMRLRVWNRLPLLVRPFLFFGRNYFLRGGFLDGRPGFIYHVLWSFWVRFMIDVEIIERRLAGRSSDSSRPGSSSEPPGFSETSSATTEDSHRKEAVAR